ncbi:hypothetical protein M8756_14435 [Lutimaribacter sp. EGI FJ00015]|uniref:Uncharacterized protein n=1 Tax=Lutimaribacter degradans TaxID=2945989 RepID=A0ACC5ZYH5_9RHOB|nr:hypothetical protein [Lutimaribacter sp. EGI FJ00013]MCM2563407.1 hypothetical protein [Lutimaribacter sp. EGI FJ00013]MCO0614514.1 hypothetical protein [Lutimaribacter sp. EGI FJ00015]MCO0637187.1 hypothetical protein [Lutimaribacter sp. EGI FJ00014]
MKTIITALSLTIAATAPAFADTTLDGTVISTMGNETFVTLHQAERGIGDNGVVSTTTGMDEQVNASRFYDPRDMGKADGPTRQVSVFSGGIKATEFGAR